MKKIGKKLCKDEQKSIFGGFVPPNGGGTSTKTGWELQNGICYCDYHVVWSDGSYADFCHLECGAFNCIPQPA